MSISAAPPRPAASASRRFPCRSASSRQLLGVALFERTNKIVTPTVACEQLIGHARAAVAEAEAILAVARNLRDPLAGRFRLGIIPTLAPYLLPLVFAPLREALPALEIEPWEDQTTALLERLRAHELDAALLATEVDGPDLASQPLFAEPFLAALPPEHPLAGREVVAEADLARDILVLADGHCLRGQALAACGYSGALGGALRASSLPTLAQHGGRRLRDDADPGARDRGGAGCGDRAAAAGGAGGADGADRLARPLSATRGGGGRGRGHRRAPAWLRGEGGGGGGLAARVIRPGRGAPG